MPEAVSSAPVSSRLATLLQFLESDPANLNLLGDAAEAALAANEPVTARKLLSRYAEMSPLPDRETNLAGLAAMREGNYAKASVLFGALASKHPGDPSLRFNLAWTQAMLKDFAGALRLLDDTTVDALGQAAALKVQLLHDQGLLDEAADLARAAIQRHPEHAGLLAATSVLAMDVSDIELARQTATRAGDQPEALVTLGTLSLGDDDPRAALALFSKALARTPEAPRAWVGQGLALLASGNSTAAVESLQHGAELFGEHVGSWIAAGWAHVLTGSVDAARACFEKAVALDHNFAESQGSLAVVNLMSGRTEEGQRLAAIAMRLDPKSFSGALASAIAVSASGRPELARSIVERALNTPIAPGGKTLAQSMTRNALGH